MGSDCVTLEGSRQKVKLIMTVVLPGLQPVVLDIPTPEGRKRLGEVIQIARAVKMGWSRRIVCERLAQTVLLPTDAGLVPYTVSDSTIRALEQGKPTQDPMLIDAIAALQFIPHPTESRPFTAQELRLISYGRLEPISGQYLPNPYKAVAPSDFSMADGRLISA